MKTAKLLLASMGLLAIVGCQQQPVYQEPESPKEKKLDVLRKPYARFICLTTLAGEVTEPRYQLQWDNDDPSLVLGYLEGRSRAIINLHPEFADTCSEAKPEKPC